MKADSVDGNCGGWALLAQRHVQQDDNAVLPRIAARVAVPPTKQREMRSVHVAVEFTRYTQRHSPW